MRTVNERLANAVISHGIDLQHYSNGVVRLIIGMLNKADIAISAELAANLTAAEGSSFSVERLESMLGSVRQLNAAAYYKVSEGLTSEVRALADAETSYQTDLFERVIPPQVRASVGIGAVNVSQVYAAAVSRPFQGRLLSEWAKSIEVTRMARIRDSVRMGVLQQKPTGEIVRQIRGTKKAGYKDGIFEIDRRAAESVVRTAVAHTAAVARDSMFEASGGLIKAQMWTSTLDSRTSQICILRDGKKYEAKSPHKPIDHKLEWLGGPGQAHWGCRSTAVPVVKSWKELGGADLPEFTATQRSSMDGQVAADQTYSVWLSKQSEARQNQVLGPVRAAMYRAGMPIDKFANDKGIWLTLDQLRQRGLEH
jgi:hypothetical protein